MDLSLSFRCFSSAQQAKDALSVKPFLARKEAQQEKGKDSKPTSRICSACGYTLSELPLKMRSWTCPNCGAEHDRDVNAAVNLLKVGAST